MGDARCYICLACLRDKWLPLNPRHHTTTSHVSRAAVFMWSVAASVGSESCRLCYGTQASGTKIADDYFYFICRPLDTKQSLRYLLSLTPSCVTALALPATISVGCVLLQSFQELAWTWISTWLCSEKDILLWSNTNIWLHLVWSVLFLMSLMNGLVKGWNTEAL